MSVMFGAIALSIYTRDAGYPVEYHRDEPSKVEQLRRNERNLFHPLFLLETTEIVRELTGVGQQDKDGIVKLGRTVSAVCMAAAIAVISFAGFWHHSLLGGFLVGLFALLHARFLEIAHYFKEDTPYLLGVSLVLLASTVYARSVGRGTAIFLGAAVGLAAASKYAGAGMLVITSAVVLAHPSASYRRWRAIGWMILAAAAVMLIVHLRMFFMEDPIGTFKRSFSQEVDWMVRGHNGIGQSTPHPIYLGYFILDFGLVSVAMLLSWVGLRRHLTRLDVILITYTAIYFLVLSFMGKISERYLLPLGLFALFYLALTPLCWTQWFQIRERNRILWVIPFFIAFFSIAIFPHYVRFKDYYRAFARDSRQELCEFISNYLPPDSFIACDKMVRLTAAQKYEGFALSRVIEERYASELGTLAELKAQGVTHLVISYDTYHRFADPGIQPQPEVADLWRASQAFYNTLRERGVRLWYRDSRNPKPLHPGLELYEIPKNLEGDSSTR